MDWSARLGQVIEVSPNFSRNSSTINAASGNVLLRNASRLCFSQRWCGGVSCSCTQPARHRLAAMLPWTLSLMDTLPALCACPTDTGTQSRDGAEGLPAPNPWAVVSLTTCLPPLIALTVAAMPWAWAWVGPVRSQPHPPSSQARLIPDAPLNLCHSVG